MRGREEREGGEEGEEKGGKEEGGKCIFSFMSTKERKEGKRQRAKEEEMRN